jgi:hypothetical protein
MILSYYGIILAQNGIVDSNGGNKLKAKLLLLITLLLLLPICILIFPWSLIFFGGQLEPNPPRPEITYGEFPFRLEYEINGQRKVIHDVLICEFDGFGWNEGTGKYRRWEKRLVSGEQDILLLKVDDSKKILFSPGSAQYYMNDLDRKKKFHSDKVAKENDSSFPDAFYEIHSKGSTLTGFVSADELLKEYHIKLLSFEPSQPVQNHFSK